MSERTIRQKSKIEAIVFDAYGTLFDTHSVRDALEAAFPRHGDYLTQLWRLKQLEYSWLRALSGDYRHFGEVTREALRYSLSTLGITAGAEQIEELVHSYDRLNLFPDALAMLDDLSNLRLAVFSNGSPEMLSALLGNAGIAERFEAVISADEVRTFKPDPRTYRLACTRLNLAPEEILLVSSNGFDLHGGAHSGLRTARVERLPAKELEAQLSKQTIGPNEMFLALRSQVEHLSLVPDVTVPALRHLPDAIRAL